MKIIALTDLHGRLKHLPALAQELQHADLVLVAGDLTQFGKRDAALEVVESIRKYNPRLLAVMGNCDYPQVTEFLEEQGLCIHASHKILDGIAFVGLGGSLPCPVPTLNEWPEQQIDKFLTRAAENIPAGTPMVLVSHQPPIDTVVDLVSIGLHVGSTAVREFIEQSKPLICFSGHIHEAIGQDRIGETILVNPGPFFEGAYAIAEVTDTVDKLEIRRIA